MDCTSAQESPTDKLPFNSNHLENIQQTNEAAHYRDTGRGQTAKLQVGKLTSNIAWEPS